MHRKIGSLPLKTRVCGPLDALLAFCSPDGAPLITAPPSPDGGLGAVSLHETTNRLLTRTHGSAILLAVYVFSKTIASLSSSVVHGFLCVRVTGLVCVLPGGW